MQDNVAITSGDVKEAIERTQEAEAYRKASYIRKFNGDKLAAEQYLEADAKRRRQNRGR